MQKQGKLKKYKSRLKNLLIFTKANYQIYQNKWQNGKQKINNLKNR